MSVAVLTPISVTYSESGAIDISFMWDGNGPYSHSFVSQAALVEFARAGLSDPIEALRYLLSGWCARDSTCSDLAEFLNRPFYVHLGQDMQGNGNADAHLLWKKGGPT